MSVIVFSWSSFYDIHGLSLRVAHVFILISGKRQRQTSCYEKFKSCFKGTSRPENTTADWSDVLHLTQTLFLLWWLWLQHIGYKRCFYVECRNISVQVILLNSSFMRSCEIREHFYNLWILFIVAYHFIFFFLYTLIAIYKYFQCRLECY